MTKNIDTQYNFWLAGYYDDFASARAIADDQNAANHRTIDHTISHFGSAIGRVARLNTRFKFSNPDRLRTGGYHDDDPKADKTDYFSQQHKTLWLLTPILANGYPEILLKMIPNCITQGLFCNTLFL